MTILAPAKLNLCLYVGSRRDGGLHEVCSLSQSLTLADRLTVEAAGADEVRCEGIEGPNLAAEALDALRSRGWRHPPVRIEIEKRIPVAAGLGGGSADAAAVLRLAAGEVEGLAEAAAELGSDVPSQIEPGLAVVSGTGEVVEALPDPGEYAVVLVPAPRGLSAAEVYSHFDSTGAPRGAGELESLRERLAGAVRSGASPLEYGELLENDLQEAAVSLAPEIEGALEALRRVGAARALVTGSGPTAFGLFGDIAQADRAAASLPSRYARAVVAAPHSYR